MVSRSWLRCMLSVLIVFVLFVLLVPAVSAEVTQSGALDYFVGGKKFTWTFDETSGVLNVSGRGAIPDYSDSEQYFMTHLRYPAGVRTVVIEEGITEIGKNIFSGLYKAAYFSFPSTLHTIGTGAFTDTNISRVILPEGLSSIGNYAFQNCENIVSIEIPHTVKKIGAGAFLNCGALEKVEIPSSVQSIGAGAFAKCPLLKIFALKNTAAYNYALTEDILFVDTAPTTTAEQKLQPGETTARVTYVLRTRVTASHTKAPKTTAAPVEAEPHERSKTALVLAILLQLIVIGGAVYLWAFKKPSKK